jgi:hypothetical protein
MACLEHRQHSKPWYGQASALLAGCDDTATCCAAYGICSLPRRRASLRAKRRGDARSGSGKGGAVEAGMGEGRGARGGAYAKVGGETIRGCGETCGEVGRETRRLEQGGWPGSMCVDVGGTHTHTHTHTLA